MSNDTTYNGWTNYPTWCWNLWMTNDEGSYSYLYEQATEAWAEAEADTHYVGQTREQAAASLLADRLEQDADEMTADILPGTAGPVHDILGWAMGQIDWHEIAEHIIDDVDKTEDEDEDGL